VTAHAKLSASGSATWLHCAAAPRLQEGIIEPTSPYAQDGTDKHAQAEHLLLNNEGDGPFPHHTDFVMPYVDHVRSLVGPKDTLLVEQRVCFDEWVPDGFGTADTIILHDNGTLSTVDLKGGLGVKVSATENSQLRLYGLGALQAHQFDHGTHTIRMVIVQPGLDHISEEVISVKELLQWGEWVKQAAQATTSPDAPATPGAKQCRWCKARFTCKARALDALNSSFGEFITAQDVAMLLPVVAKINDWTKDLEAHAMSLATNGSTIPGYKLVEGKSQRKFKDNAVEVLHAAGLSDAQIFAPAQLKPLGEIEKALGGKRKATSVLEEACVKPEGKPTLVPISDPRSELEANVTSFPEGN
jgi:hypothetical protein